MPKGRKPTQKPQTPVTTPEQPPVLEQQMPTEAPKAPQAPKAAAAPALESYIARHETTAQDAGLVVTAISHPGATECHHDGVYSGFPITAGELSATYSDGSKH
jgi:hypothetical protein